MGIGSNEVVDLSEYDISISVDSVVETRTERISVKTGKEVTYKYIPPNSRLLQESFTIILDSMEFVSPEGKNALTSLNFDQSNSLEENDPYDQRISAGKDFVRRYATLGSDNLLGVFGFGYLEGDMNGDGIDDYFFQIVQDFVRATDTILLLRAIDSVNHEYGSTPLYCSLVLTADYMENYGGNSFSKGLVSFTDGEDNSSDDCPRKDYGTGDISFQNITADSVWTVAKRYGIRIFFIALGEYINTSEMQMIADSTDGILVKVSDAGALSSVFDALGYASAGGYNEINAHIDPVPPSGSVVYMTLTACNSDGTCAEASFTSSTGQ